MSLTLGLTGMDPATETALQSAFSDANANTGGVWKLVPEQEAAYVVVDMDTVYGPMSWLRLHAADKTVIGLTAAARTQTDFKLERPITAQGLAALLREIAAAAGQTIAEGTPAVEPPADAAPAAPLSPMSPEFFTDLAASIPSTRPEAPVAAYVPEPALSEAAEPPVADVIGPASPGAAAAPALPEAWVNPDATAALDRPAPEATASAPVPKAITPSTLTEWLVSGQLHGRTRVRCGHLALFIDSDQQAYHGPASLKPLTEFFAQPIGADDFEPVTEAAWEHDTAALGGAQPLSRLVWFGGLLGGSGTLASGHDANGRYRLLKWPQTEREYPKHFRIATVMMKGPATLSEITDASGVSRQEVNDFVNASLATGFAEPYREPEPEPDAHKAAGLFGRLRGR